MVESRPQFRLAVRAVDGTPQPRRGPEQRARAAERSVSLSRAADGVAGEVEEHSNGAARLGGGWVPDLRALGVHRRQKCKERAQVNQVELPFAAGHTPGRAGRNL